MGGGAGGAAAGPIGAYGQRPILAWAGIAARGPASGPLAAETRDSSGAGGTTMRTGGNGGAAAAPRVDQDGFQLVQGRGRAAQAVPSRGLDVGVATNIGPLPAGAQGGHGDGDAQTPARGIHSQPADVQMGDGPAEGATDEGGRTDVPVAVDGGAEVGPPEGPSEPTEGELREAHARDRQLVEYLTRQGLDADHPVRAAAEAQAAESRRAWDAAKPGKAVTLRMRWAEEALTRARRSQARMEQTIDDLDRDYEEKRLHYIDQLSDLRARTKEREDKLAEVARQAAIEFGSAEVGLGGGTSTPSRSGP